MKALCFGSLNIDYIYQVDHFVQSGETLASRGMQTFSGGKGLNQAIALAKAGTDTWIAGVIGADGRFLMEELELAGVHTELLQLQKAQPTGHAIIQRTPDGDNCILLYPGANNCITQELIDRALEPFAPGDLLLISNEINALPEIIAAAHRKGMRVALSAAPMDDTIRSLPSEQLDIVVMNRVEAAQMAGLSPEAGEEELAAALNERMPQTQAVVTLGSRGAMILQHGRICRQSAVPATPVDTTSAGDTFTGYYLSSLMNGATVAEAAQTAAKAAALCITHEGSGTSIPRMSEVAAWNPPSEKA